MKKRNLFLLVLMLLLFTPITTLGASFDTIVAFGDSLSDNGNLYALDPANVPDNLYYQGRFSNGPVWVEYLARENLLNSTLMDRAFAGAQTGGDAPPGLISQVNMYVATETLPDNALFIIWIGANDFLNGSTDVQASIVNISTALGTLAAFGVENMLIVNLPDLGALPRVNRTANSFPSTVLSHIFKNALEDAIGAFKNANSDITVYEFDILSFLNEIIDDPASYGFTNVTDVSPNFAKDNIFDNSAGYAFWDDIHPTTQAHKAIANRAFELFSSDDDDGLLDGCFIRSISSFR